MIYSLVQNAFYVVQNTGRFLAQMHGTVPTASVGLAAMDYMYILVSMYVWLAFYILCTVQGLLKSPVGYCSTDPLTNTSPVVTINVQFACYCFFPPLNHLQLHSFCGFATFWPRPKKLPDIMMNWSC